MSTSELVRVRVDPQTIIVMTLDEATAYADDLGTLGTVVSPAIWGDQPDEVLTESDGTIIEVYRSIAAERYLSSQ